MSLCVFCSASSDLEDWHFQLARELGERMAAAGIPLLYGGARLGMMGTIASAAKAGGGQVIGVIPRLLLDREIAFTAADELIVTHDLMERKAVMLARASGFLVLPGGFGTLDEALEVITHKQLGYHDKPIYFLNLYGFFDPLLRYFDSLADQRFIKGDTTRLYRAVSDLNDLFAILRPEPENRPQ